MYAVNGVSITVRRGEIVGLVGESGCGKSTLARLLLRLLYPTGGTVSFDGMDLAQLSARQLRALRMRMQFVFQDPYSSLDPRMRIEESLLEPFSIHDIRLTKAERSERIGTLLHQVGLAEEHRWRYPHEISGGQCQRLSIARALALEPELLILDEPTAALDVSIQAQIIRLLEQLRQQRRLTMLFISHDLPLVGYFCDSLIVLYFGRVMECLPTGARPRHHYTRFLFDSIPVFEPGRRTPRPSSWARLRVHSKRPRVASMPSAVLRLPSNVVGSHRPWSAILRSLVCVPPSAARINSRLSGATRSTLAARERLSPHLGSDAQKVAAEDVADLPLCVTPIEQDFRQW